VPHRKQTLRWNIAVALALLFAASAVAGVALLQANIALHKGNQGAAACLRQVSTYRDSIALRKAIRDALATLAGVSRQSSMRRDLLADRAKVTFPAKPTCGGE
jgi:hypothetical protein